MPFGASRLGFRYSNTPQNTTAIGCSLFPIYVPSIANGYDPLPSTNITSSTVQIRTRFLQVGFNAGAASSRFGAINSLKYDPLGNFNYGTSDFVTPGSPWEGYSMKDASDTLIGGSNVSIMPTPSQVRIKLLGPNYYGLVLTNSGTSIGHMVVQFQALADEPVLRFQMSYTNTTSQTRRIKAFRGMDPDQDIPGTFATRLSRGILPSIPATDLVIAEGLRTNKHIGMYIPGNGFPHNASFFSSWPTSDPDTILSSNPTNSLTADYGIGVAWDFGNVNPGQTVSVCCYYVFGTSVSDIGKLIQNNIA